jgi:intracellular sulfur oxidation DsrE/DsrF family protein
MILLVASCIAVQKTNVITPTIVLQIGSGISFQNGEDLPEVTVGGMDSVNNEPVRIGNQAPATKQQGVKVVYHLSSGVEEASYGLENIRNHLVADPSVKIVVVVNGKGIELMLKGVEFRVCVDTLNRRNIDKTQVISEASIIPSGVAEIARLQFKEGYAYLRP